jgi:hypothetical protein
MEVIRQLLGVYQHLYHMTVKSECKHMYLISFYVNFTADTMIEYHEAHITIL